MVKETNNTWKSYIEKTKNNPPRPLLLKALEKIELKESALDLGAGSLNDSKYLIHFGFKNVTAIDKTSCPKEILEEIVSKKFTYIISDFESHKFPKNKYNLISAQYSLPFIKKNMFQEVFNNIVESLKKEGIFTGQLFGNRDEWNDGKDDMSFHTIKESKELLSSFEFIIFEEKEYNHVLVNNKPKHWHIFDFIIKKR